MYDFPFSLSGLEILFIANVYLRLTATFLLRACNLLRLFSFFFQDSSLEGVRFSDNGFILWGGARTVTLELSPPASKVTTEEEVRRSLTVMSYFHTEKKVEEKEGEVP